MTNNWDELKEVAARSTASKARPLPELQQYREDYRAILDQFRKDVLPLKKNL
jgi:hypothetical protein